MGSAICKIQSMRLITTGYKSNFDECLMHSIELALVPGAGPSFLDYPFGPWTNQCRVLMPFGVRPYPRSFNLHTNDTMSFPCFSIVLDNDSNHHIRDQSNVWQSHLFCIPFCVSCNHCDSLKFSIRTMIYMFMTSLEQ